MPFENALRFALFYMFVDDLAVAGGCERIPVRKSVWVSRNIGWITLARVITGAARVVRDDWMAGRTRRTEMARARSVGMRLRSGTIGRTPARVGWQWRALEGDAFAFAEDREDNQGSDDEDLQDDGYQDCAAFYATSVALLVEVAFYETIF